MKFKIGDPVRRPIDVFKPLSQWKYRYGQVIEVLDNELTTHGFYPELYKVRWEDGSESGGYLPHGLELVEEWNKR